MALGKSFEEALKEFGMEEKSMKKRVTSVVLSAAMLASAVLPTVGAGLASAETAPTAKMSASLPLQAWYDEPADSNGYNGEGWQQHATPLGNGFLGAMVFGGVAKERIQVNEHTLWSGGPGANPDYNGGIKGTAEDHAATLAEVREALAKVTAKFNEFIKANPNYTGTKKYDDFYTAAGVNKADIDAKIKSLFGEKSNFGTYQSLGDIYIADPTVKGDTVDGQKTYSNYRRTLDLNEGMVTVSYDQSGVTYTREYFISNPGNVMVMRLKASEKGKLTRAISLDSPQTNKSISGDNATSTLTMTGQPADQTKDGLKFAQQLKVVADGGSTLTLGDTVYVDNADTITMYMTAGTNYKQSVEDLEKDLNDYFTDENPLDAVKERINAAAEKGYDKQLAEHKADYKELFNAMQLNIAGVTTVPDKPTDELLANYRARYEAASKVTDPDSFEDFDWYTDEDRYLENLYFQFGRYLLISSSREGSLPANLQGIWADGLNPPWNADYHTNINLQMNYWLAEQTNLAECHLPVAEYVAAQVPRGEVIAKNYYGDDVRGFTFHHENNIWGNAAPGESGASYAPESAAWACQDIWEYYQFNQDKEFLAEYYPVLLGSALFWVDNLVENADGKLVASPSYSPEHGPFSEGATYVQGVVWEIFNEVIEASKVLDKSNDSEVKEIIAAQDKLLKPTVETSIGSSGQFLEWQYETTLDNNDDKTHRHTNHLFVLHPSNQIVAGRSEEEDQLVEAMKKTLNNRTDGGTGWSKAWKVNFWARTREGDRSHKVLSSLIGGKTPGGVIPTTADNLFDMHDPFQIDGNFGATAGIAEMLLQSQGDAVELLAATPEAWADGAVTGMKARGNVEVDMQWSHSELQTAVLRPGTDNDALKVKGTNIAKGSLVNSKGEKVAFTADGNDTIVFAAKAGETYTIQDIVDGDSLIAAENALENAITDATDALNTHKPTDELYDETANTTLNAVLDQAQALADDHQPTDKFALIDMTNALNTAVKAFNSAYDLTLGVSLDSGIYSGLNLVQLTNDSSIVNIRYTLDGTTPTKDATLYTGPIVLPYGAVKLRAAAFYDDKLVGDVASRDYLINAETDLALDATVTDSSDNNTLTGYPASRITNGNRNDRWATGSNASKDTVVTIDLKAEKTFDSYWLDEFCELKETTRVNSIKLEYLDGTEWKEITPTSVFNIDNIPDSPIASQHAHKSASFAPVTAQKVRLTMRGGSISIWEFSLYNSSTPGDKTELKALYDTCQKLNPDDYTDTAVFTAAMEAAKKILDADAPSEYEVNIAYYNLQNAKDALEAVSGKPQPVPDPEKATLPTATKDQLKAVMDKSVDLNRYTVDSAEAYNNTMVACRLVSDNPNASGENVYRALTALQKAINNLQEKPQDNWVADFTKIQGTHTVLKQGENLLYADWKQMDQGSLDTTAILPGDVDGNGHVQATDALLALKAATKAIKLDDTQEERANVDGQEGVSVIDALMILQSAADKIDLGDARGGRDQLYLQMTIQLQSTNPAVDPAKMWSGLTIKLRSADKYNVAGDPEAGTEPNKGNNEHNYGWNFSPSNFDGSSTLTVSIPLSKANTNKKGVMDWTDVERMIVQCQLNNQCTGDMYQYTMLIKDAHIVDGTPLQEATTGLSETISQAKAAGFTGDALTAAEKTLKTAQDMLAGKNALVNLYDLNKAKTDLTAAIAK